MNNASMTHKACAPFIKVFILLLVLVAPAITADAKWWIFGKGDDAGVSTRYIYINDLSYDELGEKVTLYQDSLPQGKINLRGKGAAGKNRVGAVQVSLDAKQTWQKAQVASDGSFIYSFTPEVNQIYELYVKVLDTTGKSNDIEASRKELLVSNESVQDEVYKTLDQLVKAYKDEDSFAFMRLVSDDFVSGTALLDSAIRQDFTAFDNIQLHYNLNNITRASGGNLFVAISFSRMVTSSRSGDTFSDNASTEFTFKVENGVPKIYSMKNPLVFGLSDAGNIATGTINSGENNAVLYVDSAGTVSQKTLAEIASGTTSSSSSSTSGTFTLTTYCTPPCTTADGFNFSEDRETSLIVESDIYREGNLVWGNGPVLLMDLGAISFSNVTIPATGTWDTSMGIDIQGPVFAVKLPDGTYAVIRYTGTTASTLNFDYKYNPDGSTTFN